MNTPEAGMSDPAPRPPPRHTHGSAPEIAVPRTVAPETAVPAPAPSAPVTAQRGQSIVFVAALGRNNVIGVEGRMPWHLPDDLRRFKALTMGRTLVMGRRTFEAIGRVLPGRRTIVITSDATWRHAGVDVATSPGQALDLAGPGEVMVVGGGQIYAQLFHVAERLELTHVDATPEGDTLFPHFDSGTWSVIAREEHEGYCYVTYTRASAPQTVVRRCGVDDTMTA